MSRLIMVEAAGKTLIVSTGQKRLTYQFAYKIAIQICRQLTNKDPGIVRNEIYRKFRSKEYRELSGYWNNKGNVIAEDIKGKEQLVVNPQDLIVVLTSK